MERVVGIGGVFIKSKDPGALREWYRVHLGMDIQAWGGMVFRWSTPENPNPDGATVWSVMEDSSDYFAPSTAPFMVNYRVKDLHALLAVLRAEGCDVVDKTEQSGEGAFGWVVDPDGNKV